MATTSTATTIIDEQARVCSMMTTDKEERDFSSSNVYLKPVNYDLSLFFLLLFKKITGIHLNNKCGTYSHEDEYSIISWTRVSNHVAVEQNIKFERFESKLYGRSISKSSCREAYNHVRCEMLCVQIVKI